MHPVQPQGPYFRTLLKEVRDDIKGPQNDPSNDQHFSGPTSDIWSEKFPFGVP